MTDTTSAAPSDAEIDAQWRESVEKHETTAAFVRDFARAVLARWGAPQPPNPQAVNLADRPFIVRLAEDFADDCVNAGYVTTNAASYGRLIAEAVSTHAQPVARVPLTDEQVDDLIAAKHFHAGYELTASDKVCINWYRLGLRDGERAHGIANGEHHE